MTYSKVQFRITRKIETKIPAIMVQLVMNIVLQELHSCDLFQVQNKFCFFQEYSIMCFKRILCNEATKKVGVNVKRSDSRNNVAIQVPFARFNLVAANFLKVSLSGTYL